MQSHLSGREFVMVAASAQAITEFWLGDSVDGPQQAERRRAFWYVGGPHIDGEIVARFGGIVKAALDGGLDDWEKTPVGVLALVITLDQFTRNIYRGTRAAYAGDPRAYDVMRTAMRSGLDRALPTVGRLFLYHPLHHSERLTDQDAVLALLGEMKSQHDARWHEWFDRRIAGFRGHRDIVARFGRFPHRNRVLGRESTDEELAYIEAGADSFGQSTGTKPQPNPKKQ